jgi:hypothetical protein
MVRDQLSFVEGINIPLVDDAKGNSGSGTFGGGLANATSAEALPVFSDAFRRFFYLV